MYAYVDETGNTGSNIFDEAQPEFFTGALITRSKFDVVYGRAVRSLAGEVGADALHASVLGFGPIEEVAEPLLKIVKKADARFFISRVEKRYLLATKLYDTFFDSGENPAASWTAYNVRALRLLLCFKVAMLITEEIAHDFWAMLMAKKEKDARAAIPGICDALLENLSDIPDESSRVRIRETLEWARDHPEALDIYLPGKQAKNGHMPNMVAFANLLGGLEHFSKKWKRPLNEIVHDRQSQFDNTLKIWHEMHSNASDEPIHLPGETFVFQKVKGSTFSVSASDESPGIQIADTALWLFRQQLSGTVLPRKSTKLLEHIMRKAWWNDFSFVGVGRQVKAALADMMSKPISEEAMACGAEIIDRMEQQRLDAIAFYEEDGLMPYERGRFSSLAAPDEA